MAGFVGTTELGGGDIFWATTDQAVAEWFAAANPAVEPFPRSVR